MERDETMRRDLAQAMGWRLTPRIPNPERCDFDGVRIGEPYWNCDGQCGIGELCNDEVHDPPEWKRWTQPDGKQVASAPDPLHSAEDAEALEAWLVGQGFQVIANAGQQGHLVTVFRREDDARVDAERWVPVRAEPDPARRRRRALVEAAWQAVSATRASAAEEA